MSLISILDVISFSPEHHQLQSLMSPPSILDIIEVNPPCHQPQPLVSSTSILNIINPSPWYHQPQSWIASTSVLDVINLSLGGHQPCSLMSPTSILDIIEGDICERLKGRYLWRSPNMRGQMLDELELPISWYLQRPDILWCPLLKTWASHLVSPTSSLLSLIPFFFYPI